MKKQFTIAILCLVVLAILWVRNPHPSGQKGFPIHTLDNGSVESLGFSPDGKVLASAATLRDDNEAGNSVGGGIQLWNLKTGELKENLIKISGNPLFGAGANPNITGAVSFSTDGHLFAATNYNSGLTIWDTHTWKIVNSLPVESPFSFSPDSKLLATKTSDSVTLYDITGWQIRKQIKVEGYLTQLLFSPDNKILVGVSDGNKSPNDDRDYQVTIWNTKTGSLLQRIKDQNLISSVTFSPNGKILAIGTEGSVIMLWNTQTGKLIRQWKDSSPVYCIAFSFDGEKIVSGNKSSTVCLWDIQTGKLIRQWKDVAPVYCVTFSPIGKILATGNKDGLIRFLPVN